MAYVFLQDAGLFTYQQTLDIQFVAKIVFFDNFLDRIKNLMLLLLVESPSKCKKIESFLKEDYPGSCVSNLWSFSGGALHTS